MADRRMFAKTIIDSDAFLDMPLSTQLLYFHLGMRADDYGFINNPKKIARMIGCQDDDLSILVSKKFIIKFDSGVIVLKHWKINNYIRSDRSKKTIFQDEQSRLIEKDNGSYKLLNDNQPPTTCQPDDNQSPTDDGQVVYPDKNRLDKTILDNKRKSIKEKNDSQSLSLQERIEQFKTFAFTECSPTQDQIDEFNKFLDYFTEYNDGGKKFKKETYKTFNTKLRWNQWLKRSEEFSSKYSNVKQINQNTKPIGIPQEFLDEVYGDKK